MNAMIFVSGTFVGYVDGDSIEHCADRAAEMLDLTNSPTTETLRVVQAGIGASLAECKRRYAGTKGA